MTIRLVLVRHGQSSFNAKGLIQGRTDESFLTDTGYQQARKAGEALSKINFDDIYSSPLQRAAETANTIKQSFNKKQNVIYDKNLLEVDLSSWSGLAIKDNKNKFHEVYSIWKSDPEKLTLTRNENENFQPIQELFEQFKNFLNEIFEKYSNKEDVNI